MSKLLNAFADELNRPKTPPAPKVAQAEIPVPDWATKGYFDANPAGLRALKAHWQFPVTTPEERAQAQEDAARRVAIVAAGDPLYELGFPCTGCGKFAFDEPTTCFWCRRTAEKT